MRKGEVQALRTLLESQNKSIMIVSHCHTFL